jgi:hypothetical protein
MSSFYANPISVNLTDILAKGTLQNDKVGSIYWNNTSEYSPVSKESVTTTTLGNASTIKITAKAVSTGSVNYTYLATVPEGSYPSSNPQYDYLTLAAYYNAPTTTGGYLDIFLKNSTGTNSNNIMAIQPNTAEYISLPLSTWESSASFNTTGKGISTSFQMVFIIGIPNGATIGSAYTAEITAMALTEYPLTLGTNATGATPTLINGNAKLTAFHPSFTWSNILNSGYSVATSQPLQNVTEQQTSINDGSYTEQATYQGIFSLPSAPDLTYSASNITVPLSINGNQYEVANLNGASYLTSIQSKTNGTFSFGTVNPNSQNSLVLEVEYTTAQWDASSSAPSFFSLAGIEYYWWVALLGFMGLIGLGSVAMSHFGGEEETLRVPKGKFGR